MCTGVNGGTMGRIGVSDVRGWDFQKKHSHHGGYGGRYGSM